MRFEVLMVVPVIMAS